MRRPRRPAAAGRGDGNKAPLHAEIAVGVKDGGEVPVIVLDGEDDEAPVQGVPAVASAADGGGEKTTPEAEVAVVVKDAEEVPVVAAVDGKGEASAVQATAGEGNNVAEKDEEGIKWLKHYSSMQSILIVGDGDFSFSLALATAFGSGQNLVATSLDSYDDLRRKYSKSESNIMELKRMEAEVYHCVNVKGMRFHAYLKTRRFDRIVFNFPHAGFKGKEDQLHMINLHKGLVKEFFGNARHLLRPSGEVHVTHKKGKPYDDWDIEGLALESCLVKAGDVKFKVGDYPGYNQKRGDGAKCDQPFILGDCRTFKFWIGDLKSLKKARAKRISSIPYFGDSKVHPDTLATARRPFDPLPPVPTWPRPHFPPRITSEPHPFGMAQRERSVFPENFFGMAQRERSVFPGNFYGMASSPYFHHEGTIRPMFSVSGPPPNIYQNQGSIPSPMRITNTTLLPYQEQSWYQDRPVVELLRGYDCSYSAQEYQRSLHREYEFQRQVIPGGISLGYSSFLEDRYRKSVEKQEWLRRMIALYGGH